MTETLHLLVVDDSLEYCQMIGDLLDLEGGCRSHVVHSLAARWDQLNQTQYDALILDNHLPDGDGLEALPQLSSLAIHMPVVMVTGEGDQIVASEAIKRGAYDYIVKGESGLVQLPWIIRRAVSLYRTREAQKRSEARLYYQAWLLNNVGDAIVATDDTGKVTYWNKGAEMLFKQPQADVIGKQVEKIFSKSHFDQVDSLVDLLTGGEPLEEFQIVHTGEKPIWIHARAHSLRSRVGMASGLVGIFQDINARKEFEERYQQAQSKLIHAARLSALGELASNLAHEINNPLTTMLGEAQILIRALPEGSEAGQAAKAIEAAGWRAAQYVSELINLSNPTRDDARPTSIAATWDQAIGYLKSRISASSLDIHTKIPADLPAVMAQERDLVDIWINLLTSILDAAEEPGEEVAVEAHHVPPHVVINIQAQQGLVVHLIGQGRTIVPGDLLGLAVAEELIRSLDGEMFLQNPPDEPMAMKITLPATDLSLRD